MELIKANFNNKEIYHFKSGEMEEIKLAKEKVDEKLPLILEYVKNYCDENGFKVKETHLNNYNNIDTIVLVKK